MIVTKKIINFRYSNDILSLRNKKYCRLQSLNQKIITKKKHELWLNKFLKTKNVMYGLFDNKKFIGYIRIEKTKKNLVSWAVSKNLWGQINFYKILKNKTKKNYIAKIKKQNKASQIVAIKAGFNFVKCYEKFLLFKK